MPLPGPCMIQGAFDLSRDRMRAEQVSFSSLNTIGRSIFFYQNRRPYIMIFNLSPFGDAQKDVPPPNRGDMHDLIEKLRNRRLIFCDKSLYGRE